jgi:hypothetical protein
MSNSVKRIRRKNMKGGDDITVFPSTTDDNNIQMYDASGQPVSSADIIEERMDKGDMNTITPEDMAEIASEQELFEGGSQQRRRKNQQKRSSQQKRNSKRRSQQRKQSPKKRVSPQKRK